MYVEDETYTLNKPKDLLDRHSKALTNPQLYIYTRVRLLLEPHKQIIKNKLSTSHFPWLSPIYNQTKLNNECMTLPKMQDELPNYLLIGHVCLVKL